MFYKILREEKCYEMIINDNKLIKKILSFIICICCLISLLSQSIVVGNAWDLDDKLNIASDGDAYAQSTIATVGDVTFLNDGNYQTVWSAKTSMAYAGVKLHNKYSIDKVRVVFKNYGENYDNQLNFKFSYYDSNTNQLIDLYSGSNYDENNDTTNVGHKYYSEYVLPKAIVTNEIKVTITSNSSQDMAIIAEIEAFGQKYDESLNPTNLALRKKLPHQIPIMEEILKALLMEIKKIIGMAENMVLMANTLLLI